jgi:transaldolase
MAELADAGIDIVEVTNLLEEEGVEKFIVSWNELVASVASALEAAK